MRLATALDSGEKPTRRKTARRDYLPCPVPMLCEKQQASQCQIEKLPG